MTIIGGDFNCFEGEFDKFQGIFESQAIFVIFWTLYRLIDIWRKTHGHKAQCTWFNSDKSIRSCLDKFFIHSSLSSHAVTCEILPCVFSNHDSVHLELNLDKVCSQGPGVWQLSLELLSGKDFCSVIVDVIQ